jgi:hypothetical protein
LDWESIVLLLTIAGNKLKASRPSKVPELVKLHKLDPEAVDDPNLKRRIRRAKNSKNYHEQIKKELASVKQTLIEKDAELKEKNTTIAQLEDIIACQYFKK